MKTLGYYNGTIAPLEELTIPALDRAVYFGDGIYEASLARGGKIFALEEHLNRYFSSAAMLGIRPGHSPEELSDILNSLLPQVEDDELMVYWQLSRGTGPRGHAFLPPNIPANLLVTLTPRKANPLTAPLRLISAEDTRFLHCNIKTLNLIPNVMVSERAKQSGCEEAVLHRSGRVTECCHSNISILTNGIFQTAPTDHLILPGISRAHLIAQCRTLNIPVKEEAFTLPQLMQADEVIVSSSGGLACAVCEIDARPVGGKNPAMLQALQQAVLQEFAQATS